MELFKDILGFVWDAGVSALLWTGLGALLGLLVPAVAAVLIYRKLIRHGWPDLPRGWQGWTRAGVIVFWILVIPGISVPAGAMIGAGVAFKRIVERSNVVEKSGAVAFRSLTAAVLAGLDEGADEASRQKSIERYLNGEDTVAIERLEEVATRLSGGTIEMAAEYAERRVASNTESLTGKLALRFVRWTVDWFDDTDERQRWNLFAGIADEARKRDAADDGDGRVSVEQIASSITTAYIEPQLGKLATGLLVTEIVGEVVIVALTLAGPLVVVQLVVLLRRRRGGPGIDVPPGT